MFGDNPCGFSVCVWFPCLLSGTSFGFGQPQILYQRQCHCQSLIYVVYSCKASKLRKEHFQMMMETVKKRITT